MFSYNHHLLQFLKPIATIPCKTMHQIDSQFVFSVFVQLNLQHVSPSKDHPHEVCLNIELHAMAFLSKEDDHYFWANWSNEPLPHGRGPPTMNAWIPEMSQEAESSNDTVLGAWFCSDHFLVGFCCFCVCSLQLHFCVV